MGPWLTNTQDSVICMPSGLEPSPSLPTTTFHGPRLSLGYAADILRGGQGLENAVRILLQILLSTSASFPLATP